MFFSNDYELWFNNIYSNCCQQVIITDVSNITKKLSYHKDEHPMRPINGCPKNFRESLSLPAATFAEIFNGLSAFVLIDPVNVRTKFEVHSFTHS